MVSRDGEGLGEGIVVLIVDAWVGEVMVLGLLVVEVAVGEFGLWELVN